MLKDLLKKLDECSAGGDHNWSAWVKRSYSMNHYEQEVWQERTCMKCGTVEQEHLPGEEEEDCR